METSISTETQPLLTPQKRKGSHPFAKQRHSRKDFWFCGLSIQQVETSLESDLQAGLPTAQLESRKEKYGRNEIPRVKTISPFKIFFRQFYDFMILILLVAAVVAAAIQDWIESGVLLAVVLTNTVIGFVQEYRAEKALEALERLASPVGMVIRDGAEKEVPTTDLVVGDVVLLEEGNSVPADVRITESINLEIDESILTGESVPVLKQSEPLSEEGTATLGISEALNSAFMGTTVTKGHGRGIVVRVGRKTEMGKLSQYLIPEQPTTLLQQKLKKLGKYLVLLSIVLCALVTGAGLLRRYLTAKTLTGNDAHDMIKIGISLAVSVIPEGLIAVVTITTALGVQRMAKRHAVVRKLPAVETLGSVTVVCTDKTGTLTEGKMQVEELWINGYGTYQITGHGMNPEGKFYLKGQEVPLQSMPRSLYLSLAIFALCNNSRLQQDPETNEWSSFGDPTEIALQVAACKTKHGKEAFQEDHFEFISEAAFDSERKRMTTVYTNSNHESCLVLSKGAVESIESICTLMVADNDEIIDFTEELRQKVRGMEQSMTGRGLRVLALCFKEISKDEQNIKPEDLERDMTFLGLVGIVDPPREQVRDTIRLLKDAGISVCMITGDHPRTAFATAKRLGILDSADDSTTCLGSTLEEMSSQQLAELPQFPSVFARVNPKHKVQIVKALRLRGEVSAMIGDGVNDAPAIHKANVGIAMGKSGTDLAKEAAHIILTDDNFNTLCAALEEGRRTYDNIFKFVVYLLSCNSSEIYVMFFAILSGLPVPLTAVMILWQNLVVDVPPALALGVDPPESGMLKRRPRDPKAPFLSRRFIIIILIHGFFLAGLTLGLFSFAIYVWGYSIGDRIDSPNHARAVAFMNLATLHLVHSFLARSPQTTIFSKATWNNYWLIGGVCLSFSLLFAACYIPHVQTVLHQWPLNPWDWLAIFICVLLHITFVEVTKLILRRCQPKQPSMFYQA